MPTFPRELLLELGRCYMRAVLEDYLRELDAMEDQTAAVEPEQDADGAKDSTLTDEQQHR